MIIEFDGGKIGADEPALIVAEMSANHLHSLDVALKLVDAAADAGADAFKIQTLTPDTMTIDCDNEYFIVNGGTPWDGRKLYDLYSETPFPYEWHEAIFERCKVRGLICFSTPYDPSAADFLEQFDPPMYKISSFEIFDTPLIEHVASFNKPMIISTGMAGLQDIDAAVQACRKVGNNKIVLLKCTSAYPAPLAEANIRTMADMASRFEVLVGVSDHTLGNEVSIAAVATGACFVEKHFTLSRNLGGPDAAFSIEPIELRELASSIRNIESAMGKVEYRVTASASKNRVFARSLFFVEDIRAGETITHSHVRSIRPGYGLMPSALASVIGKKATSDIVRGTPASWELIGE